MADDSGKSKQAIPDWQKAQPEKSTANDQISQAEQRSSSEATILGNVQIKSPNATSGQGQVEGQTSSPTEAEVMDQVRKFLDDPTVKSASLEKRRAFLETKGVDRAIINKALEETDQPPASIRPTSFDVADFKKTTPNPSQPQPVATRDVPPVVTYPEFLVQPQKPPPLVTIDRLLNTAYIAGSLGAVLYGVSKYLVAPMTDNLTSARHEFAQNSESQITKLNEKLSNIVSTTPSSSKFKIITDGTDSDDDSIVSDPTELFHRDIGTQTSPAPSRRLSTSSASSTPALPPKSTTEKHQDRLRILSSHLSELLSDADISEKSTVTAKDSVSELRDYLNGLMYLPPAQIEYGSWNQASLVERGRKDDAVTALKAEIRGVKGVLLSARRFPGAGAGAVVAKVGG